MPIKFTPIKFKCLQNKTLTEAQVSDHEPVFNGGICSFNLMSRGTGDNNLWKKKETVEEYQVRLAQLTAVIKELKEDHGIDVFMFQGAPQLNSDDDPGNTFYNQLSKIPGFDHLKLTPSASDPSKVESDLILPVKSKNSAICTIADNNRFTQKCLKTTRFGIKTEITEKSDNRQIHLFNLQSHPAHQVENKAWLRKMVNPKNVPTIIGGDFNITADPIDLAVLGEAGIYRKADNFDTCEGLISTSTSANHLVLDRRELLESPRTIELPTAEAAILFPKFLRYYKLYNLDIIREETMQNKQSIMAPSCMSFSPSNVDPTRTIITIKHRGVFEKFNEFTKRQQEELDKLRKHNEVLKTPMKKVDNSGRGNCMYYSYAISLMYVLRSKDDNSVIIEKIFDRLGISRAHLPGTVSDLEKLNNLLEKYKSVENKNKAFTDDERKTIIEPILGKACRNRVADVTKKNFLDKPRDTELFSSAAHGIEHAFIQELNKLNFSGVYSAEFDNNFDDKTLTTAEVYKTYGDYNPRMKNEMNKFASKNAKVFMEEFIKEWATEQNKLPPSELQDERLGNNQKRVFLELISKKTVLFFSQNNNQYLDDYITRLRTDKVYGTTEILTDLHAMVMREQKVKDEYGRFTDRTVSEIDITLNIYEVDKPKDGVVKVSDITVNKESHEHFTSLIPPHYWPPTAGVGQAQSPQKSTAPQSASPTASTPPTSPNPSVQNSSGSSTPLAQSSVPSPSAGPSSASKTAGQLKPDPMPDNGATSPRPQQAEATDIEKLKNLKAAVAQATTGYIDYSNKIWFSLFHRHGNSGRERAGKFNGEFQKIDDYKSAKETLIDFLSNDENNGNTHPHSFRTMLLQEALPNNPKPVLEKISADFDKQLEILKQTLVVAAPSSPFSNTM